MKSRITSMAIKLLMIPRIRTSFCKTRWKILRKNLRFFQQPTSGVGENVVSYNLTAFDSDAAFGCGNRMNLVLYPLAALVPDKESVKILIIGPRTEDDIYLAKALGFENTRGLDLLTYSPHIDLGDMHNMPYADDSFDAVVLGWVIAYSGDTDQAFKESLRVLKKGGHLAVGWEWVSESDKKTNLHIRGNRLNDVQDFKDAVKHPFVFENDPEISTNHHKSMIFKKR